MKWRSLLALVGDQAMFESAQLLSGSDSPAEIRRQLSRWSATGRLIQLRRGLYSLAPPFAKQVPHPFAVAARLVRPSYVSLESLPRRPALLSARMHRKERSLYF